MPVTTEKHSPKARRGIALANAGGVVLLLLSLPWMLFLFPNGVRVGGHDFQAAVGSWPGQPDRPWVSLARPLSNNRALIVGWGPRCCIFMVW